MNAPMMQVVLDKRWSKFKRPVRMLLMFNEKKEEKNITQWFVAARSHMFPLPLKHMLRMLQTIAIFSRGF